MKMYAIGITMKMYGFQYLCAKLVLYCSLAREKFLWYLSTKNKKAHKSFPTINIFLVESIIEGNYTRTIPCINDNGGTRLSHVLQCLGYRASRTR